MTALPRRLSPYTLCFILILLVALALRVVMLDSLPPALFRDEAEKALNGYMLAFTARDLDGRFLPLFIKVFGVTTSAVYQYACVPFMWLMGLSEWSARMPAVLAATLTLLFNYLFMARAVNKQTALIASLFLALSPWHIIFSRWGQQGIFLPMFASLALWSGANWAQTKRTPWLVLSAVAAGLMIYTYDVARLFVPLMLLCSFFIFLPTIRKNKKPVAIAVICGTLVVLPIAWLLLFNTGAAQARFSNVSIFSRNNTLTGILSDFLRNYWNHWSFDFLLLYGDAELRHGAGVGVLNPVEWIALLTGIVYFCLFFKRKNQFWFACLLLWPVAASLTREGVPHALRSIVALPVLQDVAAIGIYWVIRSVPARLRRLAVLLFIVVLLPGFIRFARSYYSPDYRSRSASAWQYGIKQSIQVLTPPVECALLHNGPQPQIIYYHFQGAEYLVPFYAQTMLSPELADAFIHSFVTPPWNTPPEQLADPYAQTPVFLVQPLDLIRCNAVKDYFYPIYAPFSEERAANICASVRGNQAPIHE